MDDLPQIYAACVIEYARRGDGGVLVGPFHVIGKDARDAFSLPYNEKAFEGAIEILANLGALSKYSRNGMQTFYRIEAKRFDGAMSKGDFGARYYTIRDPFGADRQEYSFLEAFHDVGSDYLREALDSYGQMIIDAADDFLEEDAAYGADSAIELESATWTGLPDRLSLSDERRAQIVRELDRVENELPQSGAPQHEQAQARALIIAVRAMLEAPEPQIDLAWEMIGRANNLAGIASLFVSIVTLFLTAGH